ncbi:MAG TPA: metallophosphoesterase, partial [Gemmatimonadales bacterium]|nr:metallophosphoesterase [Gemmatimonadales bacterium]
GVVTAVTLAHLSDLHFGRDVDLTQVEALETLIPALAPDAIVIAGDLTQRARHGELQRGLAFAQTLGRVAPTLVIPGNHDVEWWRSPFGILGRARRYRKYRRYFGDDLSPRLEIPGAVIASALTSHGVAFGSMTWNLNDLAVKGHLPASEAARVARYFQAAPPGLARIVVVHHNVLRGAISRRMGMARWGTAQQRLRATGADLILCGHDHQEGAGQVDGTVVVATTSAHTRGRIRGGRPSAFNVVTIDQDSIGVQHLRWEREGRRFVPSDLARFGRVRVAR